MAINAGMNIDEVEALSHTLSAAADKLRSASAVLDRLVRVAAWQGPTAGQFKGQWWPNHRVHLAAVQHELRQFARQAHANAREQFEASKADPAWRNYIPRPFPSNVPNQHPHVEPLPKVISFTGPDGLLGRAAALPPGEFEILCLSSDPPKYIVVMRGIDIGHGSPSKNHLQDLEGAIAARLAGRDAYARRVEAELERAGVPAGAEVMLVGHSYGAIAAMDIANDRSFNRPDDLTGSAGGGYHVRVTNVLAAGAGLRDELNSPPAGTNVLMVVNRNDPVASIIQAKAPSVAGLANMIPAVAATKVVPALVNSAANYVTGLLGDPETAAKVVAPGRVLVEFNSSVGSNPFSFHDFANYQVGLANAGTAGQAWMDAAGKEFFAGVGGMQVTTVSVPDNPAAGGV